MSWFNILKLYDIEHNRGRLKQLVNQFRNPSKGIGYLPIVWSTGIEKEIESAANRLGLNYKVYKSLGKRGLPNGNSFANGGHFMWNESKVNSILNDTEFNTVQELVDFVAHNSYLNKPYRKVIDNLFGTPEIELACEKRISKIDMPGKSRLGNLIESLTVETPYATVANILNGINDAIHRRYKGFIRPGLPFKALGIEGMGPLIKTALVGLEVWFNKKASEGVNVNELKREYNKLKERVQ